jgi:co-chaperonin GroES (HSP10)
MMNSKPGLAKTMMRNTSGLRPLGRAVLVEPTENQLKATLIAIPETVKARSMMVETQARVIEVGSEAWSNEKSPRAKPGDLVMIARFSGHLCEGPRDRKAYRMVNCEDIFCAVEE